MTTPTRDRILSNGLDLASVAGLSGVTLGVLADRVGLSKSGLFAHFRSKQQVQIELLDEMVRLGQVHVVGPAMKVEEGLPRLRALVGRWLGWSGKAGLAGGCPLAAAIFELDDLDGPVRDKVIALEAAWRAVLASLIRAAIERGELRADLDPEQFVWELCGLYLSHHASVRLLADPRADARAAEAFEALIARARP